MQIIAGGEAFNCLNIPPLRFNRQDTAAVNRRAMRSISAGGGLSATKRRASLVEMKRAVEA